MNSRPVTVIIGVIVIAVQAVLTLVVAVNALSVLGGLDAGTAGLANAQLFAALLLTIGLVSAAAIVFVWRGRGIARFVILVVGGIQALLDISSSRVTLGDLLWAIAMVVLFLPASSAWFRAKARERSGR